MPKLHWIGPFFLSLLLCLPMAAKAGDKGIDLSPEQEQAVEDVDTYFNSFTTLKGEFTQLASSGSVSSGVVMISKPGKMRFEYAPPSPYVVVSDGRWVSVVNRNKKVGDQYPLATTPLRLLLAEKMNLRKSAVIKAVDMQDGLITMRLEDKDQMVSGELFLSFDSNNNALKQWIVIDGEGRRTTITLDKLVMDQPADPALFVADIKRSSSKSGGNN